MSSLKQLIPLHVEMEQLIATKMTPLAQSYCSVCESPCCETAFCNETANSDLLQAVLQENQIIATDHNWLTTTGCSLAVGKPMVCQEYFCDWIRSEQPEQVEEIQSLLKQWKGIYQGYHRGRSLLTSPADSFSKPKLAKLIEGLQTLLKGSRDAG